MLDFCAYVIDPVTSIRQQRKHFFLKISQGKYDLNSMNDKVALT